MDVVQLKNVSSLPLNAHLSLCKPFQLLTEHDGQVYTTSEQVLCQCHLVLCFIELDAGRFFKFIVNQNKFPHNKKKTHLFT